MERNESAKSMRISLNVERVHLPNLDLLRVLAALAVCFFHLSWEGEDWFAQSFSYGYLGVNVFFCISGFITPLAMTWAGYHYRDAMKFFWSRMVRLYPVFAVTALITVILFAARNWMFAGGFENQDLGFWRLFANFTWTADFYKEDWLVPVFWTLGVEGQFIIFMLLTFPLWVHRSHLVRAAVYALWVIPPILLKDYPAFDVTIFHYSAMFAMGVTIFWRYQKVCSEWVFLILLGAAFYVHHEFASSMAARVSLGTALCVAYLPDIHSRVVAYFGRLTYSFFLIHITVGGTVMYHLRSVPNEWTYQLPMMLIATAVAVLASVALHKWVEKPCHQLARRLKAK